MLLSLCPPPTAGTRSPNSVSIPHLAVSPQQKQPQPRQRVGDGDSARGGRGRDGAARVRVWGDMGIMGGTEGDTDPPLPPAPPCLPPRCCPRAGSGWRAAGGSRTTASRWSTSMRWDTAPAGAQGMSPLSPPRRPPCAGHHPTVLPQLHNKGPGTVSGVTLSLAVPHLLGDHVLLYLLELGTEGGMDCSHHPALNPAQVGAARPLPTRGRWGESGQWVSPLCPLPAGDPPPCRSARERHPPAGAPRGGAAPGSRAGGPRPCGERVTLGTCGL